MSCKHPLKAWCIGEHPSGKPKYKITSYDAIYLIKNNNDEYVPCFQENPADFALPRITEFIEIPCGHCIGCRLDYSRTWANRCMMELKYHDTACFLTLTYDDKHLPPRNMIVDLDGVVSESPVHPLVKRDIQLFVKRLRKHYPEVKLRYYAAGEYGSLSVRPHYHMILYGVDFSEDRTIYKRTRAGFYLYNSKTLDKLWSVNGEQLGYAVVADVSWDTCAYVARYCTKKVGNSDKNIYKDYAIPREFTLMSRKPGIARQYYEDHKDSIYRYDNITLGTNEGSISFKPPRYFDMLYDYEYPSELEQIKGVRKEIGEETAKMKLNFTTLSYLDMLQSEEDNHLSRIKALSRKEV